MKSGSGNSGCCQRAAAMGLLALAAVGCGGYAGAERGEGEDAVGSTSEAVLPSGWVGTKIGTVNGAVTATYSDNGYWSVTGSGTGLYAVTGQTGSDNVYFLNKSLVGDGEVTIGQQGVSGDPLEARAMIRSQLNPTSSYVALGLRYVNSVWTWDRRSRAAIGGAVVANDLPDWYTEYKLVRRGNVITGYRSSDGFYWEPTNPPTVVTLSGLGAAAAYGVEVATRSATGIGTGLYDRLTTGKLPLGMIAQDIGGPTPAGVGSVDYDNNGGTVTVQGAGTGIKGTTDSFQFSYRTLNGDGTFITRIEPPNGPLSGTKAGLMVRRSLSGNASNAFIFMNNADELWSSKRTTSGGATAADVHFPGSFSGWLKVTRTGTSVTTYSSLDGATWTAAQTAVLGDLAATVYVGIAVTSGGNGSNATVTADSLRFLPATHQP